MLCTYVSVTVTAGSSELSFILLPSPSVCVALHRPARPTKCVLVKRLHVNATLERTVFVNAVIVVMKRSRPRVGVWDCATGYNYLLLYVLRVFCVALVYALKWKEHVIVTPQPVPCKAFTQATGFTERRFTQRAFPWLKCAVHFRTIKNKSGLEIFWKQNQAFFGLLTANEPSLQWD